MLRAFLVNGPKYLNALTQYSRMACDPEGILERIPLFTNTDTASDSRMSSPLTGLLWFDIIWINEALLGR